MLQKSIVPWLVAIFGVDYPTHITADIVRQMVGVLVKRDNVKGLGERFDALVDEYPETFDMIAEAAKYSAGPVSTSRGDFVAFN